MLTMIKLAKTDVTGYVVTCNQPTFTQMMMDNQFKLDNRSLEFRGEGNSSLVIALPEINKVIRLPKYEPDKIPNIDEIKDGLETNVLFCKDVIRQLVHPLIVEIPELVFISKNDIWRINDLVENSRLHHRRHKILPPDGSFALLMTDHCDFSKATKQEYCLSGATLSIEIKPKQGFLSLLGSSHGSCCYSSIQNDKLKQGLIDKKSSYCPLDLFSGCPSRMNKAVDALIENPQNNLRIFENAKYVFGAESPNDLDGALSNFLGSNIDGKGVFCELITKTLLHSLSEVNDCKLSQSLVDLTEQFCKEHTNIFNGNCKPKNVCSGALAEILKAQKLDTLNKDLSQDLLAFYERLLKENSNHIQKLNALSIPSHVGSAEKATTESELEFKTRKLWEYLVSLTFKDCSVIITAQKIDDSNTVEVLNEKYRVFRIAHFPVLTKVVLIDLDQKPAWKLRRLSKSGGQV